MLRLATSEAGGRGPPPLKIFFFLFLKRHLLFILVFFEKHLHRRSTLWTTCENGHFHRRLTKWTTYENRVFTGGSQITACTKDHLYKGRFVLTLGTGGWLCRLWKPPPVQRPICTDTWYRRLALPPVKTPLGPPVKTFFLLVIEHLVYLSFDFFLQLLDSIGVV